MENPEPNDPLIWDEALAAELPGKLVLVGLTYLEPNGELVEQKQFFGRVKTLAQHNGIILELEGQRHGETFTLAPDMRAFQAAAAGEYRLRSTGEVVIDPDFTATFSIHRKADEASADND